MGLLPLASCTMPSVSLCLLLVFFPRKSFFTSADVHVTVE